MTRTISILGATGSIGRQSLEVIAACGIRAAALTTNRNVKLLEEQCRCFLPELAVAFDPQAAAELKIRLADTPVRLDALLARGNTWKEALDRACALGRVAPGTAVCPPLGSDREQACWEADFYGVGLVEHDGEQVKVLVHPSTTVPEPVVALHWRLAEHIHRVVIERATSSVRFCPVGQ